MSSDSLLIEHIDTLVTMNDTGEEFPDAYIFLENGIVTELGSGMVPEVLRESAGRIIDGRGKVALPGLVNAHDHLYQSITRAVPEAQNAKLFHWLRALYPLWDCITPEAIGIASRVSMVELLLSGCTTTVDHTYVFPDIGTSQEMLSDIVSGAYELGIRLQLAIGGSTLGESKGGIRPDHMVPKENTLLDLYAWAAEEFANQELIRVIIAPSSLFAVGAEFLGKAASLAADLGLPRHIHVAETLDERSFAQAQYGNVPISLLASQGWLEEDVWVAHAVHVDDQEILEFAQTAVGIAHCPSSNMRLGSGIAPVRTYLDRGVKVGLGVDGSSSNDGGHMLGEARQALLLARVSGGAGTLTAREALHMVTKGSAAAMNRPDLGQIAVGKAADVAIFALDDISLAGAESDPVAALVLSWPPRADTVIARGKIAVEEGSIVGLEFKELLVSQRQASYKLLRTFGR